MELANGPSRWSLESEFRSPSSEHCQGKTLPLQKVGSKDAGG